MLTVLAYGASLNVLQLLHTHSLQTVDYFHFPQHWHAHTRAVLQCVRAYIRGRGRVCVSAIHLLPLS